MNKIKTHIFQKPISTILLLSFIFLFSCSNSSITGNDKIILSKSSELVDFDDIQSDDYIEVILKKYNVTFVDVVLIGSLCLFVNLKGFELPEIPEGYNNDTKSTYDFRDKFLSNSKKGESYIASYYLLSKYGIENNLTIKYPIEHISIMETGIKASKELQHGKNNSTILINKSTYDDCKNIVKIYRKSENHNKIDPILDYLEADLEKYYNKPKAEIATDFGF